MGSTVSNGVTERLEAAVALARAAGDLTLQYFQTDSFEVERKGDNSPVTVADREAEQLLRREILARFPDDSIVGEEFDNHDGHSGFRWILDPIDGTKSFISGVPLYGTLIGVEDNDQSVIGVIYVPGLNECVYAAKGAGAWYVKNDQPPQAARVADTKSLCDGTFVTSQVDTFDQRGASDTYKSLESAAYITRTWGDCYGYLLVATGRAALMVDPEMNVWDAAAILPIIEEAGGAFTDWQGTPTIRGGEGIGCNRHILNEVLEITRRQPKPA